MWAWLIASTIAAGSTPASIAAWWRRSRASALASRRRAWSRLASMTDPPCVAEIPADCHDDHIRREPESRERGPRRTYPTRATRHQLTLPCPSSLDATDPLTMPSRCLSPYSSTVCTQPAGHCENTASTTAGCMGPSANLKAGHSHRLSRWSCPADGAASIPPMGPLASRWEPPSALTAVRGPMPWTLLPGRSARPASPQRAVGRGR